MFILNVFGSLKVLIERNMTEFDVIGQRLNRPFRAYDT